MLTDTAALLAADAAAAETGQYAINYVLVERDGKCVGTDGRELVVIEGPVEGSIEPGEGTALVAADLAGPIANSGLRQCPVNVGAPADKPNCRLTIEPDEPNADFPDWQDMMKQGGDVLGRFDPRRLERVFGIFAKVAKQLSVEPQVVVLRLAGGEHPVLLVDMRVGERHVSAVLAPTKNRESDPDSSWIGKGTE